MLISLVDTTCLANMTDKTALTGDSAAIPFHSSSLTKGVLVSRSSRLIADKSSHGFLVSMWLTKPKTYFGDPSYTLGVASFVEPILWSTLAVGYHG